ncbi:MAG: hypothetical protein N2Z22_12000, partial [Turneriella sp.]|nr:hypothetical protein [Turneriella sp.]
MAEEQQATEITYTPEELETIRELTSFFDKGPGQVVSEEAPPTEDVAPLAPTEREAPKRPTTDLSKFEDVLKMDLDSFEATPQDEALDAVS